MLKIVDCANAVCAVTANKRAINNPERTLAFFTVLPAFLRCKKKRPAASHRDANWTSSSSEFFAAQLRAAPDNFVAQYGGQCQTNTFLGLRRSVQNFRGFRIGMGLILWKNNRLDAGSSRAARNCSRWCGGGW
jgi:hypothetical protein